MLWRGVMTSTTANRNFAYRALSPISHTAKVGGPAEGGVRALKSERVEWAPIFGMTCAEKHVHQY
jgi:hypothetical protein